MVKYICFRVSRNTLWIVDELVIKGCYPSPRDCFKAAINILTFFLMGLTDNTTCLTKFIENLRKEISNSIGDFLDKGIKSTKCLKVIDLSANIANKTVELGLFKDASDYVSLAMKLLIFFLSCFKNIYNEIFIGKLDTVNMSPGDMFERLAIVLSGLIECPEKLITVIKNFGELFKRYLRHGDVILEDYDEGFLMGEKTRDLVKRLVEVGAFNNETGFIDFAQTFYTFILYYYSPEPRGPYDLLDP